MADLDTSKDACTDFGGYVNGKWLAANAIPGDRTSWGAFEMLDERSTAVQRQLAEQAAAMTNATGVEKIVGDFYATGMDAAKINAQGIKPIQGRLDAIAALDSQEKIAEYLRTSAAKGENVLFGFGPEADFKDSEHEHRLRRRRAAWACRTRSYYFDADKKDKLAAYQSARRQGAGAVRRRRRRCRHAGQGRDRVRDAPGQGVEVERGAVARRLAVLQPGDARPTPTS